MWTLPFDKTNNIARKIRKADELRAENKPPIVINEAATPEAVAAIRIDTLRTPDMSADYDRLKFDLNQVMNRY
jgi:hypothetical protein